jgi:hypothetical protein
MLAQLVEITTVQEVVKRLQAGKQRSKDDVKQSSESEKCSCLSCLTQGAVKQAAMIDTDIEAGPQKMSLKCPVCLFTDPVAMPLIVQ